ncbi:uncharacterized protein LOC131948762 [Physella acuta]|uniref:uncharacterized protein LOC131948762 n=1 Tax=Physella acuta TaxID=109671 RepID=UPI0027DE2E53|nr:uncharacterized protein LOC131948762 [Physella acuta]
MVREAIKVLTCAMLFFGVCCGQDPPACSTYLFSDISFETPITQNHGECFAACVLKACFIYVYNGDTKVCNILYAKNPVSPSYDQTLRVICKYDQSHCASYPSTTFLNTTATNPTECFQDCVDNPICLTYNMPTGGICELQVADGEKFDTTEEITFNPKVRCAMDQATTTERVTTKKHCRRG